jgi:cytochrome c-type biogenesis protein CcmF
MAAVLAISILLSGIGNWYAIAALVCGFPAFSIFSEWIGNTRTRHHNRGENYFKAFGGLIRSNKPRNGGFIVHTGIILITLGIIGSSMYDVEKTQVLDKGTTMVIAGYELSCDDLVVEHGESRVKVTAIISAACKDNRMFTLRPEKHFYFDRMQSHGEAAIRTRVHEDIFVSLLDYDMETRSATIKALVNPMVIWMWIGGGIILMGGIVAFWPERKKITTALETSENDS